MDARLKSSFKSYLSATNQKAAVVCLENIEVACNNKAAAEQRKVESDKKENPLILQALAQTGNALKTLKALFPSRKWTYFVANHAELFSSTFGFGLRQAYRYERVAKHYNELKAFYEGHWDKMPCNIKKLGDFGRYLQKS